MIILPKHNALVDEATRRGHDDLSGITLLGTMMALAASIDRDCAARLARYGLSEGKFVLLYLLQGTAKGLPPNELADRAGVTRSTVTGLLDGLERDGLIQRQAHPTDRRSLTVVLSDEGKALSSTVFEEHTSWLKTLFGTLDNDERGLLHGLLQKAFRQTDTGRAKTSPAKTGANG